MSGLDVEALLDSTVAETRKSGSGRDRADRQDDHREGRASHDRDRERHHTDRSREHRKSPGQDRERSRSLENRHRDRDHVKAPRSRSRDRGHRSKGSYDGPSRRERDDKRRGDHRRRSRSPRHRSPPLEPQLTEDERDRRTVFVNQLSQRLRTKELISFFTSVGPVNEAQIVKDRVSGRSKGVGYVEFKSEEAVKKALDLTGQKLLGVPIIVQLTEAEKNRQARLADAASSTRQNPVSLHRLHVGNIHYSITEDDLKNVFDPFGEIEAVQLQYDDNGKSRGYGFVHFKEPKDAKEALDQMHNFELAGRSIRISHGSDKSNQDANGGGQRFQGSAFSGAGGRGSHAGADKTREHGASALDDTDITGVNFNNYSRDSLMKKLAQADEKTREVNGAQPSHNQAPKTERKVLSTSEAPSRCIIIRNAFNPKEEEGDSWVKELEEDMREECNTRYGQVVHISVDPSSEGDVYVKFDRLQGGQNAVMGLNGRFFGGRQLSATPMVDYVYNSMFGQKAGP